MANNLFLTSIVRPSPDSDAFVAGLHDALISLYSYLQQTPTATEFCWTWPNKRWYTDLATPFVCRAGQTLRWYHSQLDAQPYRLTTDQREITVLYRHDDWFCVFADPEIWVRADDCSPK